MNIATSARPTHSIQRVAIVHGYAAAPDAHWFPWLKSELQAEGIAATVVLLPAPDAPDAAAWESAVSAELGVLDARTVVVAHSLGAITALRVLEALPEPWELGALVLVAGFTGPLESLPVLDGYLATNVDVERIARNIHERAVIRSDADPFVPTASSDNLAKRLDAQLYVQQGAGHFLAEDGVTSLPAVLNLARIDADDR
ncbi:alpha/beta hydrolase [Arthrobacter sp. ISL-95]|uniref:RBBP9/YdeN family alpha/beta hydrolase n=1 Tax=Arthrobacter sp. ISL-95 TaxID=2819116 RepID=UPI001BE66696|nr:alpha/beta hydrolase [Arthrobacter sp. ISL-95]MBT2585655.1 alpha/beta hydrolase [Arthrobacter sp. ISL-95]